MNDTRDTLQRWLEQGRLAPADAPAALALAGVTPDIAAWRLFLDRLLLWMGSLLLGCGVAFFVAFNWEALGKFARFGLVEAVILLAMIVLAWLGPDRAGGRAALFCAALFAGALLALIGQAYQTGADTFELFAAWALLILPWVLLGRFLALWLLWLLLVNLAVLLWFGTGPTVFGLLFGFDNAAWALFALNACALLLWELAAKHGVEGLAGRTGPRLLALVSGGSITLLALVFIFASGHASPLAPLLWLATLALTLWLYRRRLPDVFMLAAAVLSAIVVVAGFLAEQLGNNGGAYLLTGILVIGMSAAGGWWLRQVLAEQNA